MKTLKLMIFFTILFVSLIQITSATLEVQKIDKGSTVVAELNNPATFDLIIDNKGLADTFEIYSLVSVSIAPKNSFNLAHGKSRLEVLAWPGEEYRENPGFLRFEYEIQGKESGVFKDSMQIKIVPLSEALQITTSPLSPGDKTIKVKIKNTENTNIKNLKLNFESSFFEDFDVISLAPNEEKEIVFEINKNIDKISAGLYLMEITADTEEGNKKLESTIDYLEKEGTSVEEKVEGFILRETSVKKTNRGNVQTTATVTIKKDIISRLFTLNSPSAKKTERSGLSVVYSWEKELAPTEFLEVKSTTNYTFPLIFLVLIVLAGLGARAYSLTPISLNKNVSFVRTKTGDFALKVNLRIKAHKHCDKIQIIDSLPAMTKLYEKFGKHPDKVDENSRRLFWNIPSLNPGEERVFSYIIYSKLNVVGRIELPAAVAVFEQNAKTQEVFSNRAFFATQS